MQNLVFVGFLKCTLGCPAGGEGSSKNVNKGNAQHAIVLEAIALALAVDAGTELLAAGVALLGKFIGLRDPNLKYLGLENMVRLAGVPAVMETVNRWPFPPLPI